MATTPLFAPFQRGFSGPLENNVVFPTLALAQAYANSPVAWIGQPIKVITTNPTDPIQNYEIQRDRTLKLMGSGDISLDEQIIVTVDIPGSGIQAGDIIPLGTFVTEVLKRLLAPEVRPSITSFTSTQGFGTKEIGQPISQVQMSAVVVRGTSNIRAARIRRLDTNAIVGTEATNIPNGGTINATDIGINSGKREWRVEVEDINGMTAMHTEYIDYIFPVLIGSRNADTLTAAETLALDRVLTRRNNVEYVHNGTNMNIFALFPIAWGMPIDIRDQSMSLLTAYQHSVVPVTIGGQNTTYNMFRTINRLWISNYRVHFIFDN